MGIIRSSPQPKLEDVDTPAEENSINAVEIICVVTEPVVEEQPPVINNETKPQIVISSTAAGSQFGSWIPKLLAAGSIEINIRSANYVKVGQLVTCMFDIKVTNITGGKKDSDIVLGGLPDISLAQSDNAGSVFISYHKDLSVDTGYISGTVSGNDIRAPLYYQKDIGKSFSKLTQIDIKVGTVLVGTVTYISNS